MLRIGIDTRGLYEYNQEPARIHNELACKVWAGSIEVPNLSVFVSEKPIRLRKWYSVFGYEVKLAESYAGFESLTVATYITKSPRRAAQLARKLKKRFGSPIVIWRTRYM